MSPDRPFGPWAFPTSFFFDAMARLTTLLLLLVATATVAMAQSDSTGRHTYIDVIQLEVSDPLYGPGNLIAVNPLKFFWLYNLSYYHRLSATFVLGGGVQIPSKSSLRGVGAQIELRFHPGRRALEGVYVAPSVGFTSLSLKEGDATATALSIGALVGYDWLFGEKLAVGIGIGYDHYFLSPSDGASEQDFSPFDTGLPAPRLEIGYAF